MDRILIVDDEPGVRHFLKKIFFREYEIFTAEDGEQAVERVRDSAPDLILLDLKLPGMDGLETLKQIREFKPDLPVVLITAFGDTDKAILSIEAGAFDYLTKPLDIAAVRQVIERALKAGRLMKSSGIERVSEDDRLTEERLIGNSSLMVEIYKLIGQVAKSDITVLILGESGTGKDLIARTLHRYSLRTERPFVAVNCAAIPENLLESELFGYEKGTFTGADSTGKPGKFEQAAGGTLFLDEIGDMSLATQSKVLRVLQDGSFQRLGGTETLHSDARILAATNKHLEKHIKEGRFRQDLFHRLNVVAVRVPPLRDHRDDMPAFLEYFIQRFNAALGLRIQGFETGLVEYLQSYDWPGNVRELENTMKKAMVMCKYDYLSLDLFKEEIPMHIHGEGDFLKGFSFMVENALNRCMDCSRAPYETIIGNVEKILIRKAMEISQGNQVQAAKLLGITRTTLRKKISDFEI
ncbi:MAG: hypothetical protein CO150_10110 [Nitrospirae bacterium CG_4_9_14_3_um_filter_53_35]|nr:MAG: hypothetical protein AUK29_08485 [Nitrospirae bacterium CG2_30_53_67]PIS36200.1 MAG: hypothetical protein COT35_12420 [Nitrospirae bacterium CG08_land_8_20_14_0_20_52_24]PIV85151.1 MAG: hypothetical protein COW52_03925 [Nitrospirae bacterium CG17_big_fil_post_rev_8_21_14_2_50_50_9]PIW84755.1 MAG: hypothetical protein COZ95_08105 [Nitrospirae bacterium CG_4_8_14_3_um_filter_50_41]PIX84892.1 MAG: hypothetical protein COZ32_11300 [Nitrospirae bacterium CG_4_10_14_3_um_filter_53_41]PJA7282